MSGSVSLNKNPAITPPNKQPAPVTRANNGDTATMKGTDSDANLDAVAIAKKAYAIYKTAVVITGKEDVIVQGDKAIVLA
jgi:hydroxyethylthiazole kinase-like sugar kinase family protein